MAKIYTSDFAWFRLLSNAGPTTDTMRLHPKCFKCKKPVDEIHACTSEETKERLVTFFCHGEEETHSFGSKYYPNEKMESLDVVFKEKP